MDDKLGGGGISNTWVSCGVTSADDVNDGGNGGKFNDNGGGDALRRMY